MEEEKYRTVRKRIWAGIVDIIVFMPFLLVDRFLISQTTNDYIIINWEAFTFFSPILYRIVAHCKYGQTIGKWVAGVKVLDISETRTISLGQSILRDSFYLAIQLLNLFYFFFIGQIRLFFKESNDLAYPLLLIWILLNIITMLSRSNRRAIYDVLAKSVVVRTE